MELKEGMYARIKNKVGYCVIGRIENINDYREPMAKYCIDIQGNDFIFVPKEMIIKASNNIIDLIEVGDFISYIYPSGLGILGFEDVKVTEGLLNILQNGENNHEYTIKSIVTKEQFESMEYRVEN